MSAAEISPAALSEPDAATYVGCGRTLFRRLVAEGRVHHIRIGEKRVIYRVADLDAMLETMAREQWA